MVEEPAIGPRSVAGAQPHYARETQQKQTHITGKLPLFIGVVVLLGALLLMLAFRSIVIPLTAAVMNLLSAGAAFGVVIAVFQYGWARTC